MKRYLLFSYGDHYSYEGEGMDQLCGHSDDLMKVLKAAMDAKPCRNLGGVVISKVVHSTVFDTETMKDVLWVHHQDKRLRLDLDEHDATLFRIAYRNGYTEIDQSAEMVVA